MFYRRGTSHGFCTKFAAMAPNLLRKVESLAAKTAQAAWPLLQYVNGKIESKPFQPKWAPGPLITSAERTFPPLGWPRSTDSLCPKCVKETRELILSGKKEVAYLIEGKPGEIKAQIIERDGKIWMVKECAKHGRFEDVMAMDPVFLQRIEKLYPGTAYKSPEAPLRNHGSSTVQYGRGSVRTVDLTNRCNMM